MLLLGVDVGVVECGGYDVVGESVVGLLSVGGFVVVEKFEEGLHFKGNFSK